MKPDPWENSEHDTTWMLKYKTKIIEKQFYYIIIFVSYLII